MAWSVGQGGNDWLDDYALPFGGNNALLPVFGNDSDNKTRVLQRRSVVTYKECAQCVITPHFRDSLTPILRRMLTLSIIEGFFQFLYLQLHYNNPTRVSGVVDSSGLELTYTSTLRQYGILAASPRGRPSHNSSLSGVEV